MWLTPPPSAAASRMGQGGASSKSSASPDSGAAGSPPASICTSLSGRGTQETYWTRLAEPAPHPGDTLLVLVLQSSSPPGRVSTGSDTQNAVLAPASGFRKRRRWGGGGNSEVECRHADTFLHAGCQLARGHPHPEHGLHPTSGCGSSRAGFRVRRRSEGTSGGGA